MKMPKVIPKETLVKSMALPLGNERQGTGRRLPLREPIAPAERQARENPRMFSIEGLPALLERMKNDPVYAAEIEHELRRPRGVSRVRHGLAARKAQGEPTLNASPNSITNALAYKEPTIIDRVPKGALYERLVVKPTTVRSAKLEHTSGFWGERLWNVYTLKYTKGYVIVTDKNSESKVFQSMGELRSAIMKSGWEIVR